MKSKIFITYPDNYKYFKSKLFTGQKGYCEIVRNVTVEPDPNNVYDNWALSKPTDKNFLFTHTIMKVKRNCGKFLVLQENNYLENSC